MSVVDPNLAHHSPQEEKKTKEILHLLLLTYLQKENMRSFLLYSLSAFMLLEAYGKLPESLGNLTSLKRVRFSQNSMEGEIPGDIARLNQMVVLSLEKNKFSGGFPHGIYNFSSLKYFFIQNNHFSGSLRTDFGKLLPNLVEFNMGYNYFKGDIPATLANMSTLQHFLINDNSMTGSIRSSIGKLRHLQYVFLSNNFWVGDLQFLDALTNCTQLVALSTSGSRLGGHLPSSLANLSTNLRFLDLANNLISGNIPHQIGNLVLNLSSNSISGEIPSSIGNLTRLERLYLANNRFEGTITPSLSNCTSLLHLLIGSNKLSGTIPQDIMQIQSLVKLDVSGNSLTGSLPEDLGQLKFLVELWAAHNKLSGQLPHTLGNCLSLETLLLEGNHFDGAFPDIQRKRKKNQQINNSATLTVSGARKELISMRERLGRRWFPTEYVFEKLFGLKVPREESPFDKEHPGLMDICPRRWKDGMEFGNMEKLAVKSETKICPKKEKERIIFS
ncbi:hypothetical protein HID58_015693 [Brassica napus]|uniref:Uncharacterized protein n=1 Tax=Brassica napus TaxID=3708 RepID=A0ABQ8DKT9_BRANA|nr:hypothetical protein HID58_015693 [Brassica napus]